MREGRGANPIVSSSFLLSFGGPHAGLCHQGQRPKTVEATMLQSPSDSDSILVHLSRLLV
jgi:hypothetical protein